MSSKTKTTATKEEGTPALVPKLRFPEFRGAAGWAAEPMGEVYSFKGNNSLSRDKLNYVGGSVRNIHYGDIHAKFSTHFDITKELVPFINESEEGVVRDENLCAEGDMIFADASEDMADIGKSIEIVSLNKERLVSGLHTILARRAGDRIALGFGGHLFKSGWVRTQIQKEAQGAKVLGISANRMRNLRLPLPYAETEQQKIAEFLSSVDELMAVQARKVDALKTHKKGLMQQLFPREGETQPRLRFPEFQNAMEWVEKRTDEWGDVLAGKALAVTAPGPLRPYLRTKNVLDGAIDVSDVLTMPMTDAEFSRFEVLDGDVLLNEGQSLGLVGRASIYRGELDQRCAMQNALLRFRAFPSTCPEFAAQAFQQCQKDGTFASIATQTTSVAHLGSSRFSALELTWPPTLAEQQRVASCLSSLDALITAETQKHEALKTHKKGLMQQLFPSLEEVGP